MHKMLAIAICIMTFAVSAAAQTVTGTEFTVSPTDTFTDPPNTMSHYGLTWGDYSNGTIGPSAMLSGYGGINMYTEGSRRLTVTPNGNIGIGTVNPVSKLHLGVGSGDGITIGNPNDTLGNGGMYAIKFYGYRDVVSNAISAKITAERTNACCGWLAQGTDLAFYTTNSLQTPNADNSSERLRIKDNGNVGIGTTNPQYPLSVNGTIQAKEVLVNTGWSDYVFGPDYKVRPLAEVAAFIKANHHLPDIPSEAEVKEKGVSLGDMQSKLLAKIEELTLQLIQLNETNTALEKRVAQLEGH